jgi:hypothetical protein
MEEVVERANAKSALKRVMQNKGSPGIDGMTVEELPAHALGASPSAEPPRWRRTPADGGGTRACSST